MTEARPFGDLPRGKARRVRPLYDRPEDVA